MESAEKEWLNKIGNRINTIREEKNMSIQMLADKSNLDRATLSNILNNGHNTTLVTIYKLCQALEVNAEDFFKK